MKNKMHLDFRILAILLFLVSVFKNVNGQYNLVPNPSFEMYDTCPNFSGQIRFAAPWVSPQKGFTPDYFNACDTASQHFVSVPDNYLGFQYARTGVAYADIVTAWFPGNPAAWNYREYIEVELTDTLIAGVNYCLRWYVSACDSCHYISNNMGMYFSDTAISYPCPGCPFPLPFSPQFENPAGNNLNDRFGWTEISGTYTAAGGEKFILIGNFHDTATTISTYTGWSNPSSNAYDYAVYYIDDALVTPCDSLTGMEEIQINNPIVVYPNPVHDKLRIDLKSFPITEILIENIIGKIVFKERNIKQSKIEIDFTNLPQGVYLVKLITASSELNYKIIKN